MFDKGKRDMSSEMIRARIDKQRAQTRRSPE